MIRNIGKTVQYYYSGSIIKSAKALIHIDFRSSSLLEGDFTGSLEGALPFWGVEDMGSQDSPLELNSMMR